MLKYWDSLSDFTMEASRTPDKHDGDKGAWFGYTSYQSILQTLKQGDTDLVQRTEKSLEAFDNLELPLLSAFETLRGVHGTRANMGEWLSGSPTPMRRKVRRPCESAPIKLYVGLTSSASISASQLEERGMLILGLLLKIQQVRPVELFLMCELGGRYGQASFQVVRVESKPLEISTAGVAIAYVGVARHLMYSWGTANHGFHGGWATGHGTQAYRDARAKELGLTQDDLVFDSLADWDADFDNPTKWMSHQLRRAGVLQAEE